MSSNITIIGGGLAGSLLSVYLAKKGFAVDVYERRPDMRKHSLDGGRSINLALSTRGIHALQEVGLFDEIRKISIPMYGRMIHSPDGSTVLQPYGKDKSEYINAVSRAELNKKLMDLAENYEKVKFHFNMRCSGANFVSGEFHFHNEESGESGLIKSEIAIATDGAASAIRMEMMKIPRFDFSQEYENYGYKELIIPSGEKGLFRMEKNALHIWPRGAFMLIALPNLEGSFTCTLFLAFDKKLGGENSFEHLDDTTKVNEFFLKNFPDFLDFVPDAAQQFVSHPTGNLITVKCFPWCAEGKAALLGDSAHAIVPFFGQGMNAAFEDCSYLNALIETYGTDWKRIFGEYQSLRKPNADAIADLAKENFIEMRDLVARPRFQLKKKIEAELQKRFPERFMPKYSMVTFHRLPYCVALERGRIQERILDDLSDGINSINEVDWSKAEMIINKNLDAIDFI